MSVTFESRSVRAALKASKNRRRANGTIAISAALLVTSSFIGLALVLEHPSRLARPPAGLELRKSLIPQEFSCPSEKCAERPAAAEPLHSP
ncbi:MAG: hypothetical protein ACLPID_03070 [Beijerinckiaceae bacterium]